MIRETRDNFIRHLVAVQPLIYREIPGGLLEIMPNWVRGYSGLSLPIYNKLLPVQPDALTVDMLADTAAFFSSRNVLYSIEIFHDLIPDGPDLLDRHQYQSLPPQMTLVLRGRPKQVDLNDKMIIDRVRTVPSLTAFCTLLHQVFDFSLQDMIKLHPVSYLRDEQHRVGLYLAFVDEKPVGAGSLFCGEGSATLANIVTIDDYRQQGIATTLTYHMLADAREEGCDVAIINATPQAYSLYSNLGFEIYTQRQWFLPPGINYEE